MKFRQNPADKNILVTAVQYNVPDKGEMSEEKCLGVAADRMRHPVLDVAD